MYCNLCSENSFCRIYGVIQGTNFDVHHRLNMECELACCNYNYEKEQYSQVWKLLKTDQRVSSLTYRTFAPLQLLLLLLMVLTVVVFHLLKQVGELCKWYGESKSMGPD